MRGEGIEAGRRRGKAEAARDSRELRDICVITCLLPLSCDHGDEESWKKAAAAGIGTGVLFPSPFFLSPKLSF